MRIELKKFGTTLVSRQDGKEAFAAFLPSLRIVPLNEKIEIDFEGVITFTPSWASEFLMPLYEKYGGRLILSASDNPSVKATIGMLEKINKLKFNKSKKI